MLKWVMNFIVIAAVFSLSTVTYAEINTSNQNTNQQIQPKNKITYESIKNLSEQQLESEIKRHNKLYWEHNSPEITDSEYDILIQRMEELNPENSVLHKPEKPVFSGKEKVKLEKPMLSLQKTYYFDNAPEGKQSLLDWLNKVKRSDNELFLVQPKYDGISADYTNGILSTRGDGNSGLNISDKIPIIELESPGYKGLLNKDTRGELIIRKDVFKKYYNKLFTPNENKYKSPRNAVAGIVNLKNIDNIEKIGLKLTLIDFNTYSYQVTYKDFAKKWSSVLKKIESLPYPMDGIVVKLADKKYSESLGFTEHHPKGQIAFKFTNLRKNSELESVDWSFGKNSITPVAKIKPIEINGITISRVSMHNIGTVEKNDWEIGDTLTIERAGDVIPYIVDSIPGKTRKPISLTNCPCCNTELIRTGNYLKCPNPDCFETKLNKLEVSVKEIGIRGLGKETLRKLMQHAKVDNLYDIYTLPEIKILKLPGFQEKSARKLFNSIQNAKYVNDFKLLTALNIYGIGEATAKKIMQQCTLEELLQMSQLQLEKINGIGKKTAENLFATLNNNKENLEKLLNILHIKQSSALLTSVK